METLAWSASTAEGGRLGELAAHSLQLQRTPLPFWFFPLEPLRWWYWLCSVGPHVFYSAALYTVLALAVAASRRKHPRRAVAIGLCTLLTLFGIHFAMTFLLTVVPHGSRWVVPPQPGYLLADLHAHSQASGGLLMPEDVVAWHMRKGYGVVAVTDSNTIRGGVRAQQIAVERHWPVVVVPGEEYRGTTHLLLLNIPHDISAADTPLPQAVAEANRLHGVVLAAHAWTGSYSYDELFKLGVAGFELVNGGFLGNESMHVLCLSQRLAEVGSLDFRAGNGVSTATVLPPWADSPQKVQQALQQGACAVIYSPVRVQRANLSWWRQLCLSFSGLVEEGRQESIPGFALWGAAAFWWQRRRSGQRSCGEEIGWLRLLVVIVLVAGTAALGVWCLWWRFHRSWNLRTEWLLWCCCLACPVAWWQAFSRSRSSG